MISSQDFQHFATALPGNGRITELEKAVACLWYAENGGHAVEMTASELAFAMTDIGLVANVNKSRLSANLKKSRLTVKGSRRDSFRVAPTRRANLDERFSPLLKQRKVKVSDDLLPDAVIQNTRKYVSELAHQINGAYDVGFFDACAVLCRRMIESLLVECFEKAGKISEIQKPDGNLAMLDAIVRITRSGGHLRLPRRTLDLIDKIKEVGDTAAHDRYHITTKQDVDDFKTGFRKVVSQLLGQAGITSKPPK